MSKELFDDIKEVVSNYGIDPCFAYAVAMIESSGRGYRQNGFPLIRFERHVMKRYLTKNKAAQHLLRKLECVRGSGWDAYEAALAIDEHYAKLSTSYGMFQVMGFNHQVVGYSTVEEFVNAMETSVTKQIDAFCKFVIANNLLPAIKARNLEKFATRYNGPNHAMNNYVGKLTKFLAEAEELTEEKKPKRKRYSNAED